MTLCMTQKIFLIDDFNREEELVAGRAFWSLNALAPGFQISVEVALTLLGLFARWSFFTVDILIHHS